MKISILGGGVNAGRRGMSTKLVDPMQSGACERAFSRGGGGRAPQRFGLFFFFPPLDQPSKKTE